MHRFLFFLFFITITNICFSQTEITWKDLEDVEFSDMYVEEVDEYV